MKIRFGKIFIPHLNYTVWVRPIRAKRPERIPNAIAYVEKINNRRCDVYLPLDDTPGSLAHELTHALQFICEARHIDFVNEQEHMGYLMQWMTGRILGYVWGPLRRRKNQAKKR
jgi:hypothetical protein